ncbi:site-specific integrase [Muribaculum sp.]|uniref:site-specific integrase n=1 Tax=Muribaculum sp. TaxID=1918611 RepID=UPI000F4A8642|nr:site-specific integrase [Muribaculum sp.]MCX4279469.1 phage integrase SAM-like domain-containing protein [Muribaculum sp.]ROT09901.1 recombinase [Muribaculaceae bacterium Isolate-037 (Harlan)]ROT12331.1 recombinase [Muribaculaceae bacterium Isolate-102 (HZI)]
MASIKRYLSSKVEGNGRSEIQFRLSLTKDIKLRLKSGIYIKPSRFNAGTIVKPRANQEEIAELKELERKIRDLEDYIYALCEDNPVERLTKEFLTKEIDRFHHPKRERKPKEVEEKLQKKFIELVEEFPTKRGLSEWRHRRYGVLSRSLHRFELYRKVKRQLPAKLDFEMFTTDILEDYERFLRNEPEIFDKYPRIFEQYPAETRKARKSRRPFPKGDNTIINIFACLRTFFHWAIEEGLTTNNPFVKYKGKTTEHYGTPYYITLEERDRIADFDLSANKSLAVQRDIFIFHCCIGCRISDLMRLTPGNIINDAVEYIASKTKGERPNVIRVPLTQRAKDILDRYKGEDSEGRILPFISSQKYNVAIKKIFKECGITRIVTILNPTTGEEEQRPINEIASSHLARRTFVGNLYKKVKDPNLVGALSGHKEGSRAFSRYRDIDDDMKKELIGLME